MGPLAGVGLAVGLLFGKLLGDRFENNQPAPERKPSLARVAVQVTLVSVAVIAAAAAYHKVRGK